MILKVGKAIYSLLSNNSAVKEKVGNKIYPLIADIETTFPFIIYKRSSVEIQTTKDKYFTEEYATIDVMVASEKYNESIDIASDVVEALNKKRGNFNDIEIKGIYFISADEDFMDDTFIQRLTFKIEI